MDEEQFVALWAATCLFGGLAFLFIGAHAGGLSLLGALLGAPIAFQLVSFDLDTAPLALTTGATVGALLAGLAGLAWKPRASRSVLARLGMIVLLGTIAAATYQAVGGYGACTSSRAGCLPNVEGWAIALLALDGAWVAFLCFFQASRAYRAWTFRSPGPQLPRVSDSFWAWLDLRVSATPRAGVRTWFIASCVAFVVADPIFDLRLGLLLLLAMLAGGGLWVWAIADIIRVPTDVPFPGGSRATWLVLCILTWMVGVALYVYLGRPNVDWGPWAARFEPPSRTYVRR